MSEQSEIVAKWKAEYERVNNKPAPDVFYHRGWFTIQLSKYRKSQVVGMIERLSKRPPAQPKEPDRGY